VKKEFPPWNFTDSQNLLVCATQLTLATSVYKSRALISPFIDVANGICMSLEFLISSLIGGATFSSLVTLSILFHFLSSCQRNSHCFSHCILRGATFSSLVTLYILIHFLSSCHRSSHCLSYCILRGPTRLRSWLRHYATSRKFAYSIPEEVTDFFQFTYSFQPHYGPGVDSASNRNEYQESSWW
jgi:hypothetical protein